MTNAANAINLEQVEFVGFDAGLADALTKIVVDKAETLAREGIIVEKTYYIEWKDLLAHGFNDTSLAFTLLIG